MVGSALKKFDFVIIDSLKLIFVKIDLKLKYFMFGYIYAKMNGTKNLSVKPMFSWFMSNWSEHGKEDHGSISDKCDREGLTPLHNWPPNQIKQIAKEKKN
jgi:hypothetical protein